MLGKTMKRFYKQAQAGAAEGGFAIRLDGKGVKTPAGRPLVVPTQALAEAVAAEWQAQETEIDPHAMPLTQLASTALDRVGPERAAILDQMLAYGATDLLCYRADGPAELADEQSRGWQPLLDWAAEHLGARLETTTGLTAITQPAPALAALDARLQQLDLWRLTAAQSACAAAGSLVLALALAEGRIDGEACFTLSCIDETHQIARWGEDAEASRRRALLRRDIAAAGQLLVLLG